MMGKMKILIFLGRDKKETPLHLATKSGNAEIVRSVLYKGCCILDKEINGHTCVHIAAIKGHVEVLKILLEAITDDQITELTNMKQQHLLHLAAEHGHVECCRMIVIRFKVLPNHLDLEQHFTHYQVKFNKVIFAFYAINS